MEARDELRAAQREAARAVEAQQHALEDMVTTPDAVAPSSTLSFGADESVDDGVLRDDPEDFFADAPAIDEAFDLSADNDDGASARVDLVDTVGADANGGARGGDDRSDGSEPFELTPRAAEAATAAISPSLRASQQQSQCEPESPSIVLARKLAIGVRGGGGWW
jgi:DNA-binding transcriptional LysR family regulator